jgi:hypothetical protein
MVLLAAQGAWAGVIASGPAQYLVPSGTRGGAPDAYAAGDASIHRVPGGMRVLHFRLPEDLVGPGHEEVILKESASAPGFLTFANPQISASCTQDQGHAVCVMKYAPDYGIELDRDAIDSFLGAKYASDPKALSAALTRSRDFQRDPEGVLIF